MSNQKVKPCPFCNNELKKRGDWDIHDHPKTGCILDGSSIVDKHLAQWNTRSLKLVEGFKEELLLATKAFVHSHIEGVYAVWTAKQEESK